VHAFDALGYHGAPASERMRCFGQTLPSVNRHEPECDLSLRRGWEMMVVEERFDPVDGENGGW
jgi:hypothetical protein